MPSLTHSSFFSTAAVAEIHAALAAGLENGTLKPVVGKQIPLAEAARAHKEILEPGATGKIHHRLLITKKK